MELVHGRRQPRREALGERLCDSARSDRVGPFAVAAQIIAGLVVLLCFAASFSTLTRGSTEESFVSGGIGRSEWPTKLSDVLPRIAAALVAAIVFVVANQRSDR